MAADKKLGLIAGGGVLPHHLIEHCQKTGRNFFVLAVENNADKAIFSPQIPHQWIRIGQAGTGFKILAAQKVEEIVTKFPTPFHIYDDRHNTPTVVGRFGSGFTHSGFFCKNRLKISWR